MTDYQDKYEGAHIPYKGPSGWGIALFIVALVGAFWFTAMHIHNITWKSPRDPTDISVPPPSK